MGSCKHIFNKRNHYVKCDDCKEEVMVGNIIKQLQTELADAEKQNKELQHRLDCGISNMAWTSIEELREIFPERKSLGESKYWGDE